MQLAAKQFQKILLKWFDHNGRKNLPWQQDKTPYRVWISEIMLQQTQVSTVIPYFDRFLQRFPNLTSLANACEDEVLHLWAGLGYYSRARNLLKAAQKIILEYNGKFPDTVAELQKLPGIGQSTAGAIRAIAFGRQAAILDGNVKRVLSRLHGIDAPINEKNTEIKLWKLAEDYAATRRTGDYTQAMMDLGATICRRSKPVCHLCPFIDHCIAHQQNTTDLLPKTKVTRSLPTRYVTFLILKKENQILLQKRPPLGIWGSLWSFPELSGSPKSKLIREFCRLKFHFSLKDFEALNSFRHTFTHFHLNIFPILIPIKKFPAKIAENETSWYDLNAPPSLGLPKPVQSIIKTIALTPIQ